MSQFFEMPKYWSFSFSFSASNEYSGLISFRIDSQESSPTSQFKSINFSALSFLYSSALISIHDYTGKTIAFTRWTFVGKVMLLLFNMLFGLVMSFRRSNENTHLLYFRSIFYAEFNTVKIKEKTLK